VVSYALSEILLIATEINMQVQGCAHTLLTLPLPWPRMRTWACNSTATERRISGQGIIILIERIQTPLFVHKAEAVLTGRRILRFHFILIERAIRLWFDRKNLVSKTHHHLSTGLGRRFTSASTDGIEFPCVPMRTTNLKHTSNNNLHRFS
jgi:hypothetical protein